MGAGAVPAPDYTRLSTDEERRATLLILTKALWPQLGAETAVVVAHWLRTGRWEPKQ